MMLTASQGCFRTRSIASPIRLIEKRSPFSQFYAWSRNSDARERQRFWLPWLTAFAALGQSKLAECAMQLISEHSSWA